MKEITTIGLDLAKQIFQVHGAEADGSPVVSRSCVGPTCWISSRSFRRAWSGWRPAAGHIIGRARSPNLVTMCV
jgi:hypothetical protein